MPPETEGHWGGREFEMPLTHGRAYSKDEIWDNFAAFIHEVAPVAEDSEALPLGVTSGGGVDTGEPSGACVAAGTGLGVGETVMRPGEGWGDGRGEVVAGGTGCVGVGAVVGTRVAVGIG